MKRKEIYPIRVNLFSFLECVDSAIQQVKNLPIGSFKRKRIQISIVGNVTLLKILVYSM